MPHRPAQRSISGDNIKDWADSEKLTMEQTVNEVQDHNHNRRLTVRQARALAIAYDVSRDDIYEAAAVRRTAFKQVTTKKGTRKRVKVATDNLILNDKQYRKGQFVPLTRKERAEREQMVKQNRLSKAKKRQNKRDVNVS